RADPPPPRGSGGGASRGERPSGSQTLVAGRGRASEVTMTIIEDVRGLELLDSRGNPTVGAVVTLSSGAQGMAAVPSGASTGAHEAVELRDGGERYLGKGVTKAVANGTERIGPEVLVLDAIDQPAADAANLTPT